MIYYKLEEAEDNLIGLKGTPLRDEYEFELILELIGDMIRATGKKRNVTLEAVHLRIL